jgi:hypothetical protein
VEVKPEPPFSDAENQKALLEREQNWLVWLFSLTAPVNRGLSSFLIFSSKAGAPMTGLNHSKHILKLLDKQFLIM